MEKDMKNKKLIYTVIIAIGVIGVTILLILGSSGKNGNTPDSPETTRDIENTVNTTIITDEPDPVPDVTDAETVPDTAEDITTAFDPDDPIGNSDIAPDEIPDTDSKVKVVEDIAEDDNKTVPAVPAETFEDKVEHIEKKKDESKPDEIADDHEVINDEVIRKKEDERKKKDEEDLKNDKPVTVISEEKTIVETTKQVTVLNEKIEIKDDAVSNGNAPVYVNPAQGGPNPFEEGGTSEIDEHNSDEFIDEGGDRPGEGIHF